MRSSTPVFRLDARRRPRVPSINSFSGDRRGAADEPEPARGRRRRRDDDGAPSAHGGPGSRGTCERGAPGGISPGTPAGSASESPSARALRRPRACRRSDAETTLMPMGGDQPGSRASLLRQPGTTHADPGREPRYSGPFPPP